MPDRSDTRYFNSTRCLGADAAAPGWTRVMAGSHCRLLLRRQHVETIEINSAQNVKKYIILNMLRKNIRLRKEYLYNKNKELKEK